MIALPLSLYSLLSSDKTMTWRLQTYGRLKHYFRVPVQTVDNSISGEYLFVLDDP
jgi:hypothetical protein